MSLIKKDYILLIFICRKYQHKALIQKNTWLRELSELNNKDNITYFHVLGDPNLEQDFLIHVQNMYLILH